MITSRWVFHLLHLCIPGTVFFGKAARLVLKSVNVLDQWLTVCKCFIVLSKASQLSQSSIPWQSFLHKQCYLFNQRAAKTNEYDPLQCIEDQVAVFQNMISRQDGCCCNSQCCMNCNRYGCSGFYSTAHCQYPFAQIRHDAYIIYRFFSWIINTYYHSKNDNASHEKKHGRRNQERGWYFAWQPAPKIK